ncbi:hypothetical protein ACFVWR_16500 [Leifsonia sp. NPDC058292]|uniref:hypothetical protein n=1 Tax=Leifsonia sp. NPDC058292 TaxID=3346428 RepID=UPI0036DEB066
MTQPATTRPVPTSAPQAQAKYQVRFDWASDGADAIARDADVVVWVDVLPPVGSDGTTDAVVAALAAASPAAAIVEGGITTASAVARWILDEQVRLGRRAMISIVAAGGLTASGAPRFAVEDQLGAGAIVDALASLGIDYTSPEAAAACAAFLGLRGAVAHLLTASVSGQEQVAAGRQPAEIAPLGRLDTDGTVVVVRAAPEPE